MQKNQADRAKTRREPLYGHVERQWVGDRPPPPLPIWRDREPRAGYGDRGRSTAIRSSIPVELSI